jgi:hypothetical protein
VKRAVSIEGSAEPLPAPRYLTTRIDDKDAAVRVFDPSSPHPYKPKEERF